MGKNKLKSKSPADFFAENKNIAGFDNAGKALFTTVRELVENGLDSAEGMLQLPEISIEIEEISKSQFNRSLGIGSPGGGIKDEQADDPDAPVDGKKKPKKAAEAVYYRLSVKDNGCGMPHKDIPNMMGKVLSSTKYGVRQARGRFGLGAKMALIWCVRRCETHSGYSAWRCQV